MPILSGASSLTITALPVAKREKHRLALRAAATSGAAKFFLGTDSAPHPDTAKESACGCAGIYTSINTISCLAHVFEEEKALDKLEAFASLNGPVFYGLPANEEHIRLYRSAEPLDFPRKIAVQNDHLSVFDPGFALFWRHEVVKPQSI